jgi:hypothetical protein
MKLCTYLDCKPLKTLKLLFILLIILNGYNSIAQKDTNLKNTVRINITNPMIFGYKSIILGYERQLKNSTAISVNVGHASFGIVTYEFLDSNDLSLEPDYQDKGFNFSIDYRKYLVSQNKYAAPRGVYLGPFYTYNYFNRVNNWTMNQESIQTDLTIQMHTLGLELGYQFVFRDRLSVDLILIGPGISYYSIDVTFNTQLNSNDQNQFYDVLNDFLNQKFPGFETAIDNGEFKATGSEKTFGMGFRYMVMVGYRF